MRFLSCLVLGPPGSAIRSTTPVGRRAAVREGFESEATTQPTRGPRCKQQPPARPSGSDGQLVAGDAGRPPWPRSGPRGPRRVPEHGQGIAFGARLWSRQRQGQQDPPPAYLGCRAGASPPAEAETARSATNPRRSRTRSPTPPAAGKAAPSTPSANGRRGLTGTPSRDYAANSDIAEKATPQVVMTRSAKGDRSPANRQPITPARRPQRPASTTLAVRATSSPSVIAATGPPPPEPTISSRRVLLPSSARLCLTPREEPHHRGSRCPRTHPVPPALTRAEFPPPP